MPLLDNWNSLGGVTLSTERWLAGAAAESAFWFIVGGADSGGSANATVDFTNL